MQLARLSWSSLTRVFGLDSILSIPIGVFLKSRKLVSSLLNLFLFLFLILAAQLNYFYCSILSDFISSYRKFHSCETSLLRMTEEWRSMQDYGTLVGIVSMDLSKAFDIIQHPLLLAKLKAYGLDKDGCALFRHYLSNRQQSVKIGDTFSSFGGC